jgi:hypothetical protein
VIAALLAFCALLIGAGVWLRASLSASFSQGDAYGRALAAAQAAVVMAQQNAAALEAERDGLQEKFDDLEKALVSTSGSSDSARARFDVGVVRALEAIGRAGADARSP